MYKGRKVMCMRDMVVQKALTNRIKSLRSEKGMSQQDLAEKMGVSRQTVSYYEVNSTSASVKSLIAIADALGCKVSDFFVGM